MNRLCRHLLLLALPLAALSSCDVHQWPQEEVPVVEPLAVNLVFSTEFTDIDYPLQPDSRANSYKAYNIPLDHGIVSYTVRSFPQNENGEIDRTKFEELTFTRAITDGYDCSFTLDLDPGRYTLMVWAMLAETPSGPFYYDASNFWDIKLVGDHTANTDYRDAFRGMVDVEVGAGLGATVQMTRPLAKFEFITTDLDDFLDKETRRRGLTLTDDSRGELDDYIVEFYYVGYMPSSYSLPQDRIVDSTTGVKFRSTLTQLSANEASMGFDYVFVNPEETHVTLQVALYDATSGDRLSMSEGIRIPVMRSYDTIVWGQFLFKKAAGGIGVDPGYNGDFNIFTPM